MPQVSIPPNEIDDDKLRITKWAFPDQKMRVTYMQCPIPFCMAINHQRHENGCPRPGQVRVKVTTTQFGPVNFGTWCWKLSQKLNAQGNIKTTVKTRDDGMVAVWEVEDSPADATED